MKASPNTVKVPQINPLTIYLLSLSIAFAALAGLSIAQVGPFFPITASGAAPVKFTKTYNHDFQHPGILHPHEDPEQMRDNVTTGKEPWKSYFNTFSNLTSTSYSYVMSTPRKNVSRNSITQGTTNAWFERDSTAAYHNTPMWYTTRNEPHANKSAEILNLWGTTLKIYDGLGANLGVSEGGMRMVNAAEILRHEYGWVEAGMKWQGTSGFSGMVYRALAPAVTASGQANYAHAWRGLGNLAIASQIVLNQEGDLYGLQNDLMLKGSEYLSKFNLNETVPYDPKYARCESILVGGAWPENPLINQRLEEWVLTMVYNHSVKLKRRTARWTEKAFNSVSVKADNSTHYLALTR